MPVQTVATVAFPDLSIFETAIACEVFGIDRTDMGAPRFEFLVCATEPGPLRTPAGFTLEAEHGLDSLERADIVIVPGWTNPAGSVPRSLVEAIRAVHARGARVLSFCSGAFVLAAAGLLDGRRATTHWMYSGLLAARYPKIKVDPNVLFVDEDPIYTSAGTAAGIDLCLHIVRLDHGAEAANVIARRMVVPPHREGGQAQYVKMPVPPTPDGGRLGETMAWAVANLDQPLTVESLAARSHLSPRTFARHFVDVTGTTPWRWLLGQRLVAAQRLLETTDTPIERVADACGFGSAAAFRLHFGRRIGVSPASYRRAFCGQGAA